MIDHLAVYRVLNDPAVEELVKVAHAPRVTPFAEEHESRQLVVFNMGDGVNARIPKQLRQLDHCVLGFPVWNKLLGDHQE